MPQLLWHFIATEQHNLNKSLLLEGIHVKVWHSTICVACGLRVHIEFLAGDEVISLAGKSLWPYSKEKYGV
jgi:hypothetical protein